MLSILINYGMEKALLFRICRLLRPCEYYQKDHDQFSSKVLKNFYKFMQWVRAHIIIDKLEKSSKFAILDVFQFHSKDLPRLS